MPTQRKNKGSRRKLTPSEISELYSGIGKRNEADEVVVAGKSIAFAGRKSKDQTERKPERLFAQEINGRIVWLQAY